MSKHKITQPVYNTVVLGNGAYGTALRVTPKASIDPSGYGATGVYAAASLTSVELINGGRIYGGLGSKATGGAGGIGVDLECNGIIHNRGAIQGGAGGYNASGTAGSGGDAVVLAAGGHVYCHGTITGGAGGNGVTAGAGGAGVVLRSNAAIRLYGSVTGGNAGATLSSDPANNYAASGGTGVYLENGGRLVVMGSLAGGLGSADTYGGGQGGDGGQGAYAAKNGTIINDGTIAGGAGGTAYDSRPYGRGGMGGDAVSAYTSLTLTNLGLIQGGTGGQSGQYYGGNGGLGVAAGRYGTVTNFGKIAGGTGIYGGSGGTGVALSYGGSVTNHGLITGGNATGSSGGDGFGGSGVVLYGYATLLNTGVITGGYGANALDGPSRGGAGAYVFSGSSVTNAGTIIGGVGGDADYRVSYSRGGTGGTGVYVVDGTLINKALIAGNTGGNGVYGAAGGSGITLFTQGAAANYGTLLGGNGGNTYSDAAGSGGSGAYLVGGYLLNAGAIIGGNGGSTNNAAQGAEGGAGVVIEDGILVTSGTITGGNGGYSKSGGTGVAGYAVRFHGGGTLVIDPGAVFVGRVDGDPDGNDSMVLAGTAAGTLAGLGSQFTYFANITELAGANWTLVNAEEVDSVITAYGQLSLDGVLTGSGTITASAGSTINVSGGGTFAGTFGGGGTVLLTAGTTLTVGASIAASSIDASAELVLVGGVGLTNQAGDTFILGGPNGGQDSQPGHRVNPDITGGNGNSFTNLGSFVADTTSGGTISVAFDNGGGVSLTAGLLDFAGTLSGGGNFTAAAGTTLEIYGGGSVGGTIASAGIVRIDGATTLLQGASLAAPTIIETASLSLGVGVSLTNAAGDSFTLGGTPPAAAYPGHRVNPDITGSSGDTITNGGTFNAVGPGLMTVGVTFNTTGHVDVSAGTLDFTATVSESGTIATQTGATTDFAAGGTFTGELSGAGTLIFGGTATLGTGVDLSAGAVIDTGVLALGNGISLTNAAGHDFTLSTATYPSYYPGHRVNPDVTGGSGDTLTNAGTLTETGLGTSDVAVAFVNTGVVVAESGKLAFLGSVDNGGLIEATGGTIAFTDQLTGSGTLQINAGGTIALLAGAATAQMVDFTAATGQLNLTHPLTFLGPIVGFGSGDVIDLIHTPVTSLTYDAGTLTVHDNKLVLAKLDIGTGYTLSNFTTLTDGHAGTLLGYA